ncbi:MAG: OmpH family outer membrane protein [Methylococcaceae bacterium]|nr:OmpH family outer membrane protein [Methylococcaceae bacterium]MCI0664610.1 OmpH family outer membrane protein [Acidobacteriota bacterium]MCI0666712.1 OmpH family outer membrane protein [Methylococcaceae bacterium]
MLTKYLIYPLFGLLLSASYAMAEMKIGFVNVPQVMAESPQVEQAKKEMEREFSARMNRLEAARNEIQRMQEKLNRDSAVMSESERNKLQNELLKTIRDAKRNEDDLREDQNIRQNELLSNINKQIQEAINELAKEGEYDLVLISGVGYRSDAIDITEKLQEKLKQKF